MKRGQATIEYVIILAFAMILAVAAISTLGDIPGIGGDSKGEIEKVYWSESAELGIASIRFTTDGGVALAVTNKKSDMIKLKTLMFTENGEDYYVDVVGKILNPLESVTVSGMLSYCESEWDREFNVTFTYELVDYELGIFTFKGKKPILGKCQ